MLLERSAAVGQVNLQHESALLLATRAGKSEVVKLLLEYGAWDAQDQQREEVLGLASAQGMARIFARFVVPTLLPSMPEEDDAVVAEGDTTQQACFSDTPSTATRREAWYREGAASTIWLEGPKQLNSAGRLIPGWSPLESPPVTSMAASSGGAVAFPRPGRTPSAYELSSEAARLRGELDRAIRKGDADRIQALTVRGAPLEAVFGSGDGNAGGVRTCVDLACASGHQQSAVALLRLAKDQGIDTALARESHAALFWAVSHGHLEVLRELLHLGADPGQRLCVPSNQESLLALAVFSVRPAETEELLKYGAWDRESEGQRRQILSWASLRKPIALVFERVGIWAAHAAIGPLPA